MGIGEIYGTRADLLPLSMVKVVKADQSDPRLLTWVGREGVELLGWAEHSRYERESLMLYPLRPDGAIDWDAMTHDPRLESAAEDSVGLREFVRKYTYSAKMVIIFWDSVAIPSVKVDGSSTNRYLPDVLVSFPEFWIYLPVEGMMLERSFAGTMTASRLPVHPVDG